MVQVLNASIAPISLTVTEGPGVHITANIDCTSWDISGSPSPTVSRSAGLAAELLEKRIHARILGLKEGRDWCTEAAIVIG